MSDFPRFASIPRLHRAVTITEKIDGTNGLISIEEHAFGQAIDTIADGVTVVIDPTGSLDEGGLPQHEYWLRAGSRNRWLTRGADNYGFAAWVQDNVKTLLADLGPGMHYGEWWGSGIQRGYGLPKGEKRFSLFNTKRWTDEFGNALSFTTPGLSVVPVLALSASGRLLNSAVEGTLDYLRDNGSFAAPGFMRPEGIVVFHSAANSMFKVTLENDETPKSQVIRETA